MINKQKSNQEGQPSDKAKDRSANVPPNDTVPVTGDQPALADVVVNQKDNMAENQSDVFSSQLQDAMGIETVEKAVDQTTVKTESKAGDEVEDVPNNSAGSTAGQPDPSLQTSVDIGCSASGAEHQVELGARSSDEKHCPIPRETHRMIKRCVKNSSLVVVSYIQAFLCISVLIFPLTFATLIF